MDRRRLLMTGGTGSLGLEILPRILERDPDLTVTLLIRERAGLGVEARLEDARRYLRRWAPMADASMVEAVAGDVTLPGLALETGASMRLRSTVTRILHLAASVKLSASLDCERATNTRGVVEVLDFAASCPFLDSITHVSTAYVAGDRGGLVREEELECGQGFHNGYEESKWEAERLVRERMGELPITILRPSIVVGDSRDGHIATLATIYPPIRRIASGDVRVISGEPDVRLDIVPVDIVSEAATRLAFLPDAIGRTYHVTAGLENRIPLVELLTRAERAVGSPLSAPLRFTPPIHAQAGRLAPFFAYLRTQPDFDDANLRRDLGAWAAARPHPRDYLRALFAHAFRKEREDGRCVRV